MNQEDRNKAAFLAVCETYKAIFQPTPGLKKKKKKTESSLALKSQRRGQGFCVRGTPLGRREREKVGWREMVVVVEGGG